MTLKNVIEARLTPRRELTRAQPDQPTARRVLADQLAVEHDVPGRWELGMVDAAQQRRLARARGADQAQDVAGGDVEVDAFEYMVVAVALVDGAQRRQQAVGTAMLMAAPVRSRTRSPASPGAARSGAWRGRSASVSGSW